MNNYNSVDDALKKFCSIVLHPEKYMDTEEKIFLATRELSFTYQEEFKWFLNTLKFKTNKELMKKDTCVWTKNCKENTLLDNIINLCEIDNCIIPDNLHIEINKENFKINSNNKLKLKKLS